MAKLTPLAKGLISISVLGAAAAAAWNFGLKDIVSGSGLPSVGGASQATGDAPAVAGQQGKQAAAAQPGGAVGTSDNPLKVSIVSFHGYAPALLANGRSLTTKPGSIFAQKGVNVEFVIQDDIPTLATIFESNTAHCAWRTSDFWAQEQPNLRNAGLDARAVMAVDNTQGADAIITRDSSIHRVEDLAGHNVALLQFTPSHGMVIDAIENSSLTARKRESIKMVYINAEEGTAGVRAAFEAGNVDAAALWDPDLSLALKKIPGASVVYSTKTASNLIYDVIVCDQRVLQNPANQNAMQGFVDGWMTGVTAAKSNPDDAVESLVNTEEFFGLLAKDQGKPFIKELFGNLVWTGLEDNARVFGLAGGTNHYDRVYRRFDGIYRAAGALANPKSPVIEPQDSVDLRYIKALLEKNKPAQVAAAKPEHVFSDAGREVAAAKEATVTKPVTVGFASGTADLTKRAQKTIDDEMVPFIENNGSAYFEISGNTDSTGSARANLQLSQVRAKAVVDYLVAQWEFPRERFKIVGNGSDKPLCDEKNPGADELSLEDCRALNRTTRTAVLTR